LTRSSFFDLGVSAGAHFASDSIGAASLTRKSEVWLQRTLSMNAPFTQEQIIFGRIKRDVSYVAYLYGFASYQNQVIGKHSICSVGTDGRTANVSSSFVTLTEYLLVEKYIVVCKRN